MSVNNVFGWVLTVFAALVIGVLMMGFDSDKALVRVLDVSHVDEMLDRGALAAVDKAVEKVDTEAVVGDAVHGAVGRFLKEEFDGRVEKAISESVTRAVSKAMAERDRSAKANTMLPSCAQTEDPLMRKRTEGNSEEGRLFLRTFRTEMTESRLLGCQGHTALTGDEAADAEFALCFAPGLPSGEVK